MTDSENIREALALLDRFTEAFNRQDIAAMDATLHFPHFLPGPKPVVWEKPGVLRGDFFPQLVASGWAFSRYTRRDVILAAKERVHFLVEYDRCRSDETVISTQQAVWIVTFLNDRWGIQVRSNQ